LRAKWPEPADHFRVIAHFLRTQHQPVLVAAYIGEQKSLDALSSALEGFIRAQGKPVRHVALPAVASAGDLSD
jgi:hypothetical protein